MDYLKTPKQINESKERFIYLLTSDGHRDSVSLDSGALDINGLKKLLIEEQMEMFGRKVIEDTIKIEDRGLDTHGLLPFKYKDYDGEIEEYSYGFFKLNII